MKDKKPTTKICKACESEIPKKASRCKNCRAKQPKDFWKSPWFYLFMIFIFPVIMAGQFGDGTLSTSRSNTTNTSTGSQVTSNWEYATKKDELDDSETKFAITDSTNKLKFDFPYNGGTTFTLTLRNRKSKDEILLRCSKCQFIGAGAYDNEALRIRLDDGGFASYGYTQPSDYSSDVVFISSSTRLISGLKTAKELKIEAPFYQEGSQVIKFNVDGLEWH